MYIMYFDFAKVRLFPDVAIKKYQLFFMSLRFKNGTLSPKGSKISMSMKGYENQPWHLIFLKTCKIECLLFLKTCKTQHLLFLKS